MNDNGLSLNQCAVGTGPFMMTEFVRDRRHVMKRNSDLPRRALSLRRRGRATPRRGCSPTAASACPSSTRCYVTIEKEKVPRKEKFKQGYLDVPEIERPEWGVDFRNDANNSDDVKRRFEERGYKFPLMTDISDWYLGFNMLDPVVGRGDSAGAAGEATGSCARRCRSPSTGKRATSGSSSARAASPPTGRCRRACSARAKAQGDFHNPVTHKIENGKIVRRSIDEAKQLLAEAGYSERPRCDDRQARWSSTTTLQRALTPEAQDRERLDGPPVRQARHPARGARHRLQPVPGQDAARASTRSIWAGWLADYPDAENFLFLLYGPNAKSKTQGENVSNYENPEYDKPVPRAAGARRRPAEAGDHRQDGGHGAAGRALVVRLLPWGGLAFQQWVYNGKPSILIRDMAKYYRVDPAACASPSRPSGTSRPGGRWCCWSRSRSGWCGSRAAATRRGSGRPRCPSAPRRCRRPKRPSSPVLNYFIRRVGYGVLILIGRQLLHLLPVLHRQHA